MTVAQDDTDFLSTANSKIDLDDFIFEPITSKPTTELPFTDFRLAYQEATPLAPKERFPEYFALNYREKAISSTETPDHTYIPELNLYILTRHLPLLKLIQAEISSPNYLHLPHGTTATYGKRCSGPLCRRAKRLKAQDMTLHSRHRRAKRLDPTVKMSKILTDPRARYRFMRTRSKTYAGAEPLQFLFSAKELIRVPRSNLSNQEQHLARLVAQSLIYPYMLSIFSPDIQ